MKFSLFAVFDNYSHVYDRTPDQLREEVIEQTIFAEQLGYDGYWYAEHHFSEYGVMPNSALIMALLATQTKRIRLGTGIVTLPFRNPLLVAEDYAYIDELLGGRLNFGTGSGYLPHEVAGFQLDIKEKYTLFYESLAIIHQAWKGEEFSFHGQKFHIDNIRLNVKPVQQPVPTWVATLHKESVVRVAQKGYQLMGLPYVTGNSISEMKEVLDLYREERRKSGFDPANVHIPLCMHTYVAETREQAYEEAKEHLNLYLKTRQYGKGAQIEDLIAKGQFLYGTPDDVIDMLRKYESIGMDEIMMFMNFGGISKEKAMRSMELAASHVFPAFREKSSVS